MATDDERREVAERLRGLNGNVSHVRRVYEAEGLSVFCDDQADYYQICDAVAGYLPAEHMHPCDYEELHDCLADLIDPDTTTDTTKSPELTTKCDRDALLGLARWAKSNAWYFALDHPEDELRNRLTEAAEYFSEVERSIREACGEVVE